MNCASSGLRVSFHPRAASELSTADWMVKSGLSEVLRIWTSSTMFCGAAGSMKILSDILVWTSRLRLEMATPVAAHPASDREIINAVPAKSLFIIISYDSVLFSRAQLNSLGAALSHILSDTLSLMRNLAAGLTHKDGARPLGSS